MSVLGQGKAGVDSPYVRHVVLGEGRGAIQLLWAQVMYHSVGLPEAQSQHHCNCG